MTSPVGTAAAAGGRAHVGWAGVLAVTSLLALVVAYVAAVSVIGTGNVIVKFETGELEPGTDIANAQAAVLASIGLAVTALASGAAAVAVRRTKLVLIVTAAVLGGLLLWVPVGLFAYSLAF
jgi:hypothetical protein